jgi:hypothetical protein
MESPTLFSDLLKVWHTLYWTHNHYDNIRSQCEDLQIFNKRKISISYFFYSSSFFRKSTFKAPNEFEVGCLPNDLKSFFNNHRIERMLKRGFWILFCMIRVTWQTSSSDWIYFLWEMNWMNSLSPPDNLQNSNKNRAEKIRKTSIKQCKYCLLCKPLRTQSNIK